VDALLMLDGHAAFFNALFLVLAIVTAVNGYLYLNVRGRDVSEFYILLATATLGAMVLASAQHFASLLLGLEILSISLYTLIAYPEEGHPPLEAALKYLVLSGVGSTTALFGMALIYNATGSLQFMEISPAAVEEADWWYRMGAVFFLAGMAFKLSLVPFHMWTPDVYQGAPTVVTGFLATVSKAAVFAVLLRLVMQSGMLSDASLFQLLSVIAVVSMVVGNVLALLQDDLKRLLAYSSIAHIGYLIIALLAVAVLEDDRFAAEAALVFVAGYAVMTLAAFTVLGLLDVRGEGQCPIEIVDGLLWRSPVLGFVLAAALLSLAGIPLTAGFIAKFYLFAVGADGALWNLVWAMILGSAIGIYYYLKVVFALSRRELRQAMDHDEPNGGMIGAVTAIFLGITIIALGTYPTGLIDAVRSLVG